MKKIMIADDHYIVRVGMKWLIHEKIGAFIIDGARDGDETVELVKENNYDLILLDINMPRSCGITLVKMLLDFRPSLKIIIHTVAAESLYAVRYFKAGAYGFLPKNAEPEEVKLAIQTVLSGKSILKSRF